MAIVCEPARPADVTTSTCYAGRYVVKEREFHWSFQPALAYEDASWLGLSQVENGCWAVAGSLLVLLPQKNIAWYRQHLDTMNKFGGKCGQNEGS